MAPQHETLTKAARTFQLSGVAMLGAAAIAVSSVQPMPELAPRLPVESLGVDLAAAIDPITPWVRTFTTAAANIKTLLQFYGQKPLPLLQTFGANAKTYLGEIGSGDTNLIPGQITNNIRTLFQAPFSPGETVAFPLPPGSQTSLATGEYLSGTSTGVTTPNLSYKLLFAEAVAQSGSAACQEGGDCLVVNASPVLNLINSHFSGLFIGLFGTFLGPFFQLGNSLTAIGDFAKAGEIAAAINELVNIPANATNAFLNGFGYFDRTAAVGQLIPGGLPVDSIGVELGGLLSSTPYNGSVLDPNNPPTRWTGGVAFDGVTTTTGSTTLKGLKLGFLGSVVGIGQFLADELRVTSPHSGAAVVSAAAAVPETRAPAAVQTTSTVEDAPTEINLPKSLVADNGPAGAQTPAPRRGRAQSSAANAGGEGIGNTARAAAAIGDTSTKSPARQHNSDSQESPRSQPASSAPDHP